MNCRLTSRTIVLITVGLFAFKALFATIPMTNSETLIIEAEDFDEQVGIQVESCEEGGQNIGYIENGDYVKFNNIDFGDGEETMAFRVASDTDGGTINLYIDSKSGDPHSTITVLGTGGWQSWETVSGSMDKVSGVHNIFVEFKGRGGYLFNINWLLFGEVPIEQDVTLIFPYDNEELTNIACSFKARIKSNGPYELQLCRKEDFSETITKRSALPDRESGAKKDNHNLVYFMTYQGKLKSHMKWILDTGVWYWRITGDGGQSFSEIRKLIVNDELSITPRSHEISSKKPLFHFRLGGRPIEYASDPQAALAGIVPDELKDVMVLDIGHQWHQFHKGEDLFTYSKKYDDLGFKFSVDLGLASSHGRIVTPGEIEKIYRDLPNFVGGEIAEMFYKYRAEEIDNSQLYACLQLSRKYGKFFMFCDMNWRWGQWQPFNYMFYDIFNKENYNDYFLPVYKSTDPFGAYTCMSAIQGMKLSGMVNNIGVWSDMWTWEKFGQVNEMAIDNWLGAGHSSGEEKVFPYIQNMKQFIYGMTFGSTVFMVEPELQWDWAAKPNDLYFRYLKPFMMAVVLENIIPSIEAVNKNYHVIVDTELTSPDPGATETLSYLEGTTYGDFLRNTYGIADIPGYQETVSAGFGTIQRSAYLEMIPNTDRYPSGIPFLPKPSTPAPVVNGKALDVVKISDMLTKQAVNSTMNQYYPESANEAYAVKIDSSIFVFNTIENHDIIQHYNIQLQNAGIDSLFGDIALMSYVMGRIRSDGQTLFFQTNAYVKDNALPVVGAKYNLPSYPSILKFKCQLEPTLKSDEMSAISKSWDNEKGIFTIEINHESAGAVDFTLAGDPNISYEADSLVIEKQSLSIAVPKQVMLKGQIYPETLQGVTITWQSMNPAVASISPKGMITGNGEGTCKMVAYAGGKSDTLEINVTEIEISNFELKENELTLVEGDTAMLSANFYPENASFTNLKWQVRRKYTASVDQNGMVIANKKGETYIVATHEASGLTDTCFIYVSKRTTIEQLTVDDIYIYPNPAKDMLFVKGVDEESTFTIMSLSGRTISSSQELPLKLYGLSQGVYMLKIESDNKVLFKKLLIKR